jgi:hypothetical protein
LLSTIAVNLCWPSLSSPVLATMIGSPFSFQRPPAMSRTICESFVGLMLRLLWFWLRMTSAIAGVIVFISLKISLRLRCTHC